MLLFSLGPGPLTFVVVNEMLPLALRGKVVALSLLLNRMASGSIALTFLSLKEAIGVVAAFTLYAGLGLAVTVFYHLCVPDATGKSLEENESGVHSGLAAADGAADGGGGAGWVALVEEAPRPASTNRGGPNAPAEASRPGVETPIVRATSGSADGGGAQAAPNYGTAGDGTSQLAQVTR